MEVIRAGMDFSEKKFIYFIGIGGISMSGIAELLLNKGFKVSGSDMNESPITNTLKELGVEVFIGQSADNVPLDADYVVYTAAIKQDNPELIAAKKLNLKLVSRAEFLGLIMKSYDECLCVAGTHGKTTTTGMISEIALAASKDPTISIGGMLPSIGGNFKAGSDALFISEACEYTNSFLSFFPTVGVILNIEADHLDFFSGIEDIRDSFHKFAALIPENGTLVINGDMDCLPLICRDIPARIVTFGQDSKNDYFIDNVKFDTQARTTFSLHKKGGETEVLTLSVPGLHNALNAAAAYAVAEVLCISPDTIRESLMNYHGTARRFQIKGETSSGAIVIDDYAHHPTEIKATLATANKVDHNTIWCVFQPHTYSRTKALMNEFADVLKSADRVILPDIYAARETDTLGVSSEILAREINKKGGRAYYIPKFGDIKKFLRQNCINQDLLITMGAGDVYKIGDDMISN